MLEAILPKQRICVEGYLLSCNECTRRMALSNEGKQLCEWRSKGIADQQQVPYKLLVQF